MTKPKFDPKHTETRLLIQYALAEFKNVIIDIMIQTSVIEAKQAERRAAREEQIEERREQREVAREERRWAREEEQERKRAEKYKSQS